METLFLLFKVIFMAVFGLSLIMADKHLNTARGPMPVWLIAAAQTPVIILYMLLG
jgi:hypothetical protein